MEIRGFVLGDGPRHRGQRAWSVARRVTYLVNARPRVFNARDPHYPRGVDVIRDFHVLVSRPGDEFREILRARARRIV